MYSISQRVESGWIVAWKEEGMPAMLLMGEGGLYPRHHVGEALCEMFPRVLRFPIISQSERDTFMARWFPQTISYEREIAEGSFASAAL
jgi:hypothetical protein